jgi:hypothetical protein
MGHGYTRPTRATRGVLRTSAAPFVLNGGYAFDCIGYNTAHFLEDLERSG